MGIEEIWKTVPDEELNGYIQASNYGRIRRCGAPKLKDKIMKPYVHNKALWVTISLPNFNKKMTVASLMNRAFDLDGEGRIYDYRDGNIENCAEWNLIKVSKRCDSSMPKYEAFFDVWENGEKVKSKSIGFDTAGEIYEEFPRIMVDICLSNLNRAINFKSRDGKIQTTLIITETRG